MSDNKKIRDGRDADKVDSKDANEVNYVHQQFPSLTVTQVKAAIAEAGPRRASIFRCIRRKYRL